MRQRVFALVPSSADVLYESRCNWTTKDRRDADSSCSGKISMSQKTMSIVHVRRMWGLVGKRVSIKNDRLRGTAEPCSFRETERTVSFHQVTIGGIVNAASERMSPLGKRRVPTLEMLSHFIDAQNGKCYGLLCMSKECWPRSTSTRVLIRP
jgi:hypothetical protein